MAKARAEGLEDLLAQHWEEVALHQDRFPLAPDWDRYRLMERQGTLRSIVAHRGSKFIGYNCFFVQPSLHYRSAVFALNDILYVHPAERKGTLGMNLIRKTETMLKSIGAHKVIYHAKTHLKLGHAGKHDLGDLFEVMGYTHEEEVWAKVL